MSVDSTFKRSVVEVHVVLYKLDLLLLCSLMTVVLHLSLMFIISRSVLLLIQRLI